MSHRFVTDPDSQVVAVVWSGDFDLEAFQAFANDILALSELLDPRGILHDMRDVEHKIDVKELGHARQMQMQLRPERAPDRRMAFIVKSTYQFGMMRQLLTMVVADDNILVTYSEEEARAFVGLGADVDLSADGSETARQ